jgi:hypothetical protein
MKTQHSIVAGLALALLSTLDPHCWTAFAQGSLDPPGPPAPTMKTLDQIEPRRWIASLPFTITNAGSYYLAASLYADAGSGVIIACGNVTLDLNGFALSGGEASSFGIYIQNAQTANSRNLVVEHLTVSDGNSGLYLYGSQITDCVVHGCAVDGITAFNGAVRNCRAQANGGSGIYVMPGTVSGCWVQNNSQSGIYLSGAGCAARGNHCAGNNPSASAAHAGIYVSGPNNRVEENHVSASGSAGIRVSSAVGYTNNIIVRNSVSGNGANNYVTPGNQAVGPLITTSGTITNLNPWANFSY